MFCVIFGSARGLGRVTVPPDTWQLSCLLNINVLPTWQSVTAMGRTDWHAIYIYNYMIECNKHKIEYSELFTIFYNIMNQYYICIIYINKWIYRYTGQLPTLSTRMRCLHCFPCRVSPGILSRLGRQTTPSRISCWCWPAPDWRPWRFIAPGTPGTGWFGELLCHGDHGDCGNCDKWMMFFSFFFLWRENFWVLRGQSSSPTLGWGTSHVIATIGRAWLCISFCSEYTHSASTEIIQPNMWYKKTMAEWFHILICAVIICIKESVYTQ